MGQTKNNQENKEFAKGLQEDGRAGEALPGDTGPESVAMSIVTAVPMSSKDTALRVKDTEERMSIVAEFIKKNLKKGSDFVQLDMWDKKTNSYKRSKPFLAKPGSEKFVILFGHRAEFEWIKQDWELGLFAVRCKIVNRTTGEFYGEGFGSARKDEKTTKDGKVIWTENESMKMACKRAQIDATLRVYGLSEYFTQDEEVVARNRQNSPNNTQPAQTQAFYPASEAQRKKIFAVLHEIGLSKEKFEAYVNQTSGIDGIENLSSSWASKYIQMLEQKKAQLTPKEPEPDIPTIQLEDEKLPGEETKDDEELGSDEL